METGLSETSPFDSFFLAGFECATHRRLDGHRLDLIEGTAHDRLADHDYASIASLGMRTARDGLRWHLIERHPRHYDWSSFLPTLRAASRRKVQVIWDLCHYGWPDDLVIWRPEFVDRFAAFAAAAARLVRAESDNVPFYCPVNEISFFAWAGGDNYMINPFGWERGDDLKHQLIRASIAAMDAIRDVDPRARFVFAEPAIHIACDPSRPHEAGIADWYRSTQYEAWEMLAGNVAPALGGAARYLDLVGVNYYWNNQWVHGGDTILDDDPLYRPLREILAEAHYRYGRPVFIAETGREEPERVSWLSYVCTEARAAIRAGIPVVGICLYPVLDYPGWDDDRHCPCGVLGMPESDVRAVHMPLATELRRQQRSFASLFAERERRLAV